jgi:hypothetical protein
MNMQIKIIYIYNKGELKWLNQNSYQHPDNVEAGEVTEIYHLVLKKLKQMNFLCEWENTPQTRQIYFNDEAFDYTEVTYH